ncbi:MAG TPA: DUF1501 domain-containing protein [Ideonella sp.]|uniref:DUF1501 domain-containing protein n=1 Tax=Ideonella sp. TaxID=1929293 RepID=UPI002CC687BD|nr:DUF1501 domain-containing protein [Ideonella sp.]HSI46727.1 DUF1501 domain-containing protein [Ideonella sp.]
MTGFDASLSFSRRGLLRAAGAGALLGAASGLSTLALAGPGQPGGPRLVFVILRGGLDGLYAVPAIGDPAFASARGPLAEYASAPLPLQGVFALHPALTELHGMYQRNEAAVLHAVGLSYHERSHFDAQQVLESGGTQPYQLKDGWLGRALQADARKGLAMNTAVPLVLRGSRNIDTWAPSRMPDPSDDLLQRLSRMYGNDAVLAAALQRARGLRDGADGDAMADGMAGGKASAAFPALCARAAEFLAQDQGPQVAVLEIEGWDSHADQAAPKGRLSANLRQLDTGLAALRTGLTAPGANDAWRRTVIMVATEFGRTVEVNGTRGTDHGTGAAAFLLGGAVRGGRVIADWPGLAAAQRFEGRDLKVTTDLRAPMKALLGEHLRVASTAIERDVFPGSAAIKPADGLLKA